MVILIFYLLIIDAIKYVIPIVPLWNFDSSTINLLSTSQQYEYTIYSFSQNSFSVNLKKTITKNTDGSISEKNTLIINSDSKETSGKIFIVVMTLVMLYTFVQKEKTI